MMVNKNKNFVLFENSNMEINCACCGSNAKLKFHRKLEESNAELILADID